jgi:hypothetical protein
MKRWCLLSLLLAASLAMLAPERASAQIGSATDVITGLVVDADGHPVADAAVTATSLETQVTRRARTDVRGRFTILFPDGGGQYRMSARAVGLNPRIEVIQRYADEDRLSWNPRLGGGALTLDTINVRAGPRLAQENEGPTPGSSERAFTTAMLQLLPVDASDLANLASLIPGVTSIAGTDSSATSFSVAGLGADANAQTLDGLLFGNSSLPTEGLRSTRVVTSSYDVSRGQFSGGIISSTTRGGSNVVQGSSGYQLRDEALAIPDDSSQFAQGYTQNIISGGVGGPLIKDKLFAFGSFQARLRSDPQQTLLSAQSADYLRLGVHPDSVARLFTILDSLGVPHLSVPGSSTRSNNNLSGLLRLDYVFSENHSLTLRGDWNGTTQDPSRLGALALPQTGGQNTSSGGGLMATITSHFGATLLNEARVYVNRTTRSGDAFTQLPAGRVQVASTLPDGTFGVTTLAFGGNSGFPSRANSTTYEASNELSWLPGTGGHRFKIGALFQDARSNSLTGSNLLGTFTFNSLHDLQYGLPASFRRSVNVTERLAEDYQYGVYAGDIWVITRPFQLTYGVRLDGSSFGRAPAYNAAVSSVFGRSNDQLPVEWRFSPRAGFTWSLGGQPFQPGRFPTPPKVVIRGGLGLFRSQPPSGLVAQARSNTGLAQSSGDVFCNGAGVPTPQWNQYWNNPDSIPSQCGVVGPPVSGFQTPRSVVLLQEGFQTPRAWRGSLGLEKRFTQIFRFTLDASFSRGVAQYGLYDLNLSTSALRGFTLANEGGRPVYVTPADITPITGVPRFAASRMDSTFARVLEARSNLASQSTQVTVGLGGVFGRGIQLGASYTWQRTRDQSVGTNGSTSGDPNVAEWARSDFERRHSFTLTLTYPVSQSLEITTLGRLSSGTPYTPLVGGDVNGDGSRNDRAFIFAPGAATGVAQAMQTLLAAASPAVQQCLQGQIGTVAARNSCTGPWQGTLDFQVNWRPTMLGLNRRLTVSLVTVNFLHGLDRLVNGVDGEKGWGLSPRPDNTLLYVTGFDPVAKQYTYQVNGRFGATAGTATAFRPPFQIGINMRITIGPDRQRQALDAMRAGGGGGGFGGPGGMGGGGFGRPNFNLDEMVNRVATALPNPAKTAIDMKDSLGLDAGQISLLQPLSDSLTYRNRVRVDSLRAVIAAGGANPNFQQIMPTLRPLFEEARTDVGQSMTTVRAILREDQWAKLPDAVKNFQANAQRMRQGPPGGRPGEFRREP